MRIIMECELPSHSVRHKDRPSSSLGQLVGRGAKRFEVITYRSVIVHDDTHRLAQGMSVSFAFDVFHLFGSVKVSEKGEPVRPAIHKTDSSRERKLVFE